MHIRGRTIEIIVMCLLISLITIQLIRNKPPVKSTKRGQSEQGNISPVRSPRGDKLQQANGKQQQKKTKAAKAKKRKKGFTLIKPSKKDKSKANKPAKLSKGSKDKYKSDSPSSGSGHTINWLHCPKCGTSFGLALYRYACGKGADHVRWMTRADAQKLPKKYGVSRDEPSIYGKGFMSALDIQYPVSKCNKVVIEHHSQLESKTHIYAIFRNPETRLLSAFHYHCHIIGLNKGRRKTLRDTVLSEVNIYRRFDKFLKFPGVLGCQIKFALGMENAAVMFTRRDDMEPMVKNAAKFVKSAGVIFFGFMDEWRSSMCLFAHTTGTRHEAHLDENVRNTSRITSSTSYQYHDSPIFVTDEQRTELDKTKVFSNKPIGSGVIAPGFDCKNSFDPWDCYFIQELLPTFEARVHSSGCESYLKSNKSTSRR